MLIFRCSRKEKGCSVLMTRFTHPSSSLGQPHGKNHRDPLAIPPISLAVKANQILLLKFDRQKNISGHRYSQNHVAYSHRGCRPEGKQPTQIERMANELIGSWCLKGNRRKLS